MKIFCASDTALSDTHTHTRTHTHTHNQGTVNATESINRGPCLLRPHKTTWSHLACLPASTSSARPCPTHRHIHGISAIRYHVFSCILIAYVALLWVGMSCRFKYTPHTHHDRHCIVVIGLRDLETSTLVLCAWDTSNHVTLHDTWYFGHPLT